MATRRRRSGRAVVRLTLPPVNPEPIRPTFQSAAVGTRLYRVYSAEPYKTKPLTFRTHGPLLRFDHHRHPFTAPATDRRRGILYAAYDPTCSIGEFFDGQITLEGNRIARLAVTERLKLLDLRQLAATGVGTTQAIGAEGNRRITQAWARYLYDHPALAGVHGLLYTASNSGLDAVALWERAKGKVSCGRGNSWALADPAIRPDIEFAAHRLTWPDPYLAN